MPYRSGNGMAWSGNGMARQRHGGAGQMSIERMLARRRRRGALLRRRHPLRRRQRAVVYMARAIADGCRLVGPAALVVSAQRTREMAVLRQTLQPKMNQGYEAEVAPPGIPGVGKRG